jgi:hypothetical protein
MLEHILCAIFGHCYVVERVIAPYWRKVGCTRCCRSWGMHDPTRAFVPWDGEQEEMARRNHPAADELRPGEVMFIDPDNKSAVYKVPDVSGVAPTQATSKLYCHACAARVDKPCGDGCLIEDEGDADGVQPSQATSTKGGE